jgi:enoyl-CoA hydratase
MRPGFTFICIVVTKRNAALGGTLDIDTDTTGAAGAAGSNDLVLAERIEVDSRGAQLALMTLNRPDQRNPLTHEVFLEIGRLAAMFDDDDDVRAIAIIGTGPAFSAGGDLKAYAELQRDVPRFTTLLEDVNRVLSSLTTLSKPMIALVNGVCVAGGLELLLRCDVAFAAESSQIGDAHLNVGQIGGGGVLALLPRSIGPGRARELILSGRLLSSAEALDWGLVQRVVPDDELIQAGIDFARGVATKSPLGVAEVKRVLNLSAFGDAAALISVEQATTALYCSTSHDAHEGLLAFAAKRRPEFRGN